MTEQILQNKKGNSLSKKKKHNIINNNKKDNIMKTTILWHTFKNVDLLKSALLHPSAEKNLEFQRLEFLGDRILAYHITQLIFFNNVEVDEGKMTMLLSHLVSSKTIYKVSSNYIKEHIIHTGEITENMISDSFEAILAAIFLDGGDVYNIILKLWEDMTYITKDNDFKSPKNQLQEILQDVCLYTIKNNKNIFIASVEGKNKEAKGIGKNKKEATINAARNLLMKIKKSQEKKK